VEAYIFSKQMMTNRKAYGKNFKGKVKPYFKIWSGVIMSSIYIDSKFGQKQNSLQRSHVGVGLLCLQQI
jgi:hypothetical protein